MLHNCMPFSQLPASEIGPCLEEHSQQTEKQLPNITKLVEDKKSAANILEEFTHPCMEDLAGN